MPRRNRRRNVRQSFRRLKKWLRRQKQGGQLSPPQNSQPNYSRLSKLVRKWRLKRRLSYAQLRQSTFERDNYACQKKEKPDGDICGWQGTLNFDPLPNPRARHLTVHHINHVHNDHRFDPIDRDNLTTNNVVTWCSWCHEEFHRRNG